MIPFILKKKKTKQNRAHSTIGGKNSSYHDLKNGSTIDLSCSFSRLSVHGPAF